jgi:protein gp37
LIKQWQGKSQKEIKALGRELDGVVHNGYPIPRQNFLAKP